MTIRPLLLAFTLVFLPLSSATGQDWQAVYEAYERGDYATVIELVRPFAEQGDAYAQFALGVMYAEGKGVPQDHAEAVRWYREVAAQGAADAQYNLGAMYAEGKGVPQDHAEAARWYHKAAEQGDAEAQGELGLMYAEGKGMPQDYVLAYAWLNLAEMSDDDEVEWTKKIQWLMSDEQIARAQEMSTNLFNRINQLPSK